MNKIFYPYRQPDGYRSILEAVCRADARKHLTACCGPGVRFCEVEIDHETVNDILRRDDKNEIVGQFLSEKHNFLT